MVIVVGVVVAGITVCVLVAVVVVMPSIVARLQTYKFYRQFWGLLRATTYPCRYLRWCQLYWLFRTSYWQKCQCTKRRWYWTVSLRCLQIKVWLVAGVQVCCWSGDFGWGVGDQVWWPYICGCSLWNMLLGGSGVSGREELGSGVQGVVVVIYWLHNEEKGMNTPCHRISSEWWHLSSRPVTVFVFPEYFITPESAWGKPAMLQWHILQLDDA